MSNICIWRSRLKAYSGTNSPFLQLIDIHYHLFPWIRTDLLRHNCQLSFCTWISCGTWSVIHHLWYPEIYHKPIYALLPHVGPLWNLSQQWSLSIVGAQQPWVIESHPSDDHPWLVGRISNSDRKSSGELSQEYSHASENRTQKVGHMFS